MEDYRYNRSYSKKRKKKMSPRQRQVYIRVGIMALVLVLILLCGAWVFFRNRTFKTYKVKQRIEMNNSTEFCCIEKYLKGYLKIGSDGATYFDKNSTIWNEGFDLVQPVYDIEDSYVAVADMKSTEIYLYDQLGLLKRISLSHEIMDLEVSKQGVVAVATNDGDACYIEIRDKEGNELITAKSIFASSGYLIDIALSPDGSKLAAVFVSANEGNLESKVVFYNFANGESSENLVVGGFAQYDSTVLTNAQFLDDNKVVVVGDDAITIYDYKEVPEIIFEELNKEWEIQSLFFGDEVVGFILEDDKEDHNYRINVYDKKGKVIMDKGFDFAYNKVTFAGRNVVLYSVNDCEIYSFSGVERFSFTFDERIQALAGMGNSTDLIYAISGETQFIKLK